MTPDLARQLDELEASLVPMRERSGARLDDDTLFEGLPFNLAGRDREWALRAHDALNLLRLLPGDRALDILDLGAWNGWLCHQFARAGHRVVAADYFVDAYDGLAARRHYSTQFDAIRVDLGDLSVIDHAFDVVVLNHGIAFFTDPLDHVRNALAKVRRGGRLFVLGLHFYRDPSRRRLEVEELEQRYRRQTGRPLFFRPTRGYLDWNDRRAMQETGLTLHPYRHLRRANLCSRIVRRRPWSCYASARAR